MARSKKARKGRAREKTAKGRKRNVGRSKSNQPFEHDAKRRIGQYGGAGEPPIMQ
jgi:hypothetical protein